MKLFSKTKKNPGWLVLEFQPEGVCLTHLLPGDKPQVRLAEFYPFAQTSLNTVLTRINKEHNLIRYDCSYLLSPNEYQISSVETPTVPQDELKTAVRWLLKDMLDYHIDDATIDVLGIPADKNATTRKAMMYVISARNQLIAQKQAYFDDAQIPLAVIDIPELAQRNIANLIAPADRGIALLSVNQTGSLLTISYNSELYLSRRLDMNLQQLSNTQTDHRQQIFEKISLELQRTFDHVDRQYNFINLSRLTVTTNLPELTELTVYLSANIYIPAETLDLATVFDFSLTPELQSAAQQLRFQTCLGAALRLEEKIL